MHPSNRTENTFQERPESSELDAPMRCVVCGSEKIRPLCKVGQYSIETCSECSTDFVTNPPTNDELAAFYDRAQWFEAGEEGGYENYDEQTQPSLDRIRSFLNTFAGKGLAILDVGCGYGNHLELAASMGWVCFGIEPSDHARSMAKKRLGRRATIVKSAEELIPHEFDVVLLLDVIEHVSEPRQLFYPLFALGAIREYTTILASTPNAGSRQALQNPECWRYRHPPSHLVYYRSSGLEQLFKSLRFREITVTGIHASEDGDADDLSRYEGLEALAKGSDFIGFMQERYVPSTWSEIAEYEHLPRYLLARRWATGQRVLDFGCGTGYGTAILADVASSALGLDIDDSALDWARHNHLRQNLSFEKNSSFASDLEPGSFDLVTCFEMIEHVDEEDQLRTITGLSRSLKNDGVLLISTPNPAITKLYGENPYHLRERTREEFYELLEDHFEHIEIIDQHALVGIFFSNINKDSWEVNPLNRPSLQEATSLAYIAICSNAPIAGLTNSIFADTKREYIQTSLRLHHQITTARLEQYSAQQQTNNLLDSLQIRQNEQQAADNAYSGEPPSDVRKLEVELLKCKASLAARNLELAELTRQLKSLRNSRWTQLGALLRRRGQPLLRSYGRSRVLLAQGKRQFLKPLHHLSTFKQLPDSTDRGNSNNSNTFAYRVQHPEEHSPERVPVLHAIANFCLGGSSRLVVDLMEKLGNDYAHSVLTRHVPDPPAYTNLDIQVISHPASSRPIRDVLMRYKPGFVHIHYWGDCDLDWYIQVFEACEQLSIPVLQNVNTPVAPFQSTSIRSNVYVSEYVRSTFGPDDDLATVIHPGSNFDHFTSDEPNSHAEDCIGMVYRLENDKLNEDSIEVFIEVAQRRPSTRCLIVGDGELMEPFRISVERAGVAGNFAFSGYVKYEELPNYYKQMTLFVAPVWKESFGQVTPFAMNMGIPVVGYAVGALPDIINDPTLMADYGDIAKLTQIIIDLLDDHERRARIGKRNQERAKQSYSLEAMIASYSSVYQSLAERRR